MGEYVLISIPDSLPLPVRRVLDKGLRRLEQIAEEEGIAPGYFDTVPVLVGATFALYPKIGLHKRKAIVETCINFLTESAIQSKRLRSHKGSEH